mgnify:FL=1
MEEIGFNYRPKRKLNGITKVDREAVIKYGIHQSITALCRNWPVGAALGKARETG